MQSPSSPSPLHILTLQQENLVDLWQANQFRGTLDESTRSASGENRNCGDRVLYVLSIHSNRFVDGRYDGAGCVLCLGTAAALIEYSIGKDLSELLDLQIKVEPRVAMNRLKCIALAVDTFKKALYG